MHLRREIQFCRGRTRTTWTRYHIYCLSIKTLKSHIAIKYLYSHSMSKWLSHNYSLIAILYGHDMKDSIKLLEDYIILQVCPYFLRITLLNYDIKSRLYISKSKYCTHTVRTNEVQFMSLRVQYTVYVCWVWLLYVYYVSNLQNNPLHALRLLALWSVTHGGLSAAQYEHFSQLFLQVNNKYNKYLYNDMIML